MITKRIERSILFALFCVHACESLSSRATKSKQKPIERVAIVGSGIAGLSLAHALTNSPTLSDGFDGSIDVSLFDSRASLKNAEGAGVQLNGGMVTLGKINPALQQEAIKASVSVGTIRARNKSWFGDSTDPLYDISLEEIIRKAGGDVAEELMSNGKVMWFGIMRRALQEILLENLPEKVKLSVTCSKTLTGIRAHERGGAICEFSDGSEEGPFDCVVGCDGINSAVKEYVMTGSITNDGSKQESTLYSGIRVRYAVKDGDSSEKRDPVQDFRQYFADGAYALRAAFGNGPGKPQSECVFIVFLDDDYLGPFKKTKDAVLSPVSENADWRYDNRKPLVDTRQDMLDQIRASNISTQDVSEVVAKADRFFEAGVYFHNPFSFVGWSRVIPSSAGACAVLCGDSAHAMPPFLGQGANQAIQDSYCLAKQIFDYNTQARAQDGLGNEQIQPKELKDLLEEYEHRRFYPTASITVKAAVIGYLETGGPDGIISKGRDVLFKFLAGVGIAARVLLDAATPKV